MLELLGTRPTPRGSRPNRSSPSRRSSRRRPGSRGAPRPAEELQQERSPSFRPRRRASTGRPTSRPPGSLRPGPQRPAAAFFTAFAAAAANEPVDSWKATSAGTPSRLGEPPPDAIRGESFAFFGRRSAASRAGGALEALLAATDRASARRSASSTSSAPSARSRRRESASWSRTACRPQARIEALPGWGPDEEGGAREAGRLPREDRLPGHVARLFELPISRASYFENVVKAHAFEEKRNLAKLGKPIDRTEWSMTPPT